MNYSKRQRFCDQKSPNQKAKEADISTKTRKWKPWAQIAAETNNNCPRLQLKKIESNIFEKNYTVVMDMNSK